MTSILEKARAFYDLENFEFDQVGGHDGGRNLVYVCKQKDEKKYVLRISALGDRTMKTAKATSSAASIPSTIRRGAADLELM